MGAASSTAKQILKELLVRDVGEVAAKEAVSKGASEALAKAERRSILRRIFKGGLKEASEEDLEKLFASKAKDKLYRLESQPRRLMSEGFKEELLEKPALQPGVERWLSKRGYTEGEIDTLTREGLPKHLEKEIVDSGLVKSRADIYDEPGLYWSATKEDFPIPSHKSLSREANLVEGIRNPNLGEYPELALKERGAEVIQKKPKSILARYKEGDESLYKLLGATGVAGSAISLSPSEAKALDANELWNRLSDTNNPNYYNSMKERRAMEESGLSPLKIALIIAAGAAAGAYGISRIIARKALKKGAQEIIERDLAESAARQVEREITTGASPNVKKVIEARLGGAKGEIPVVDSPVVKVKGALSEKPVSSAASRLVGTEYKDLTITKVTKGSGNHRYITLSDGHTELVDKDFIHHLSRKVGTEQQLAKFEAGSNESRLAQAYKALRTHKKRGLIDQKQVASYFKDFKSQLESQGIAAPTTSLVQCDGRYFTLPKLYADLLEKEGILKTIKVL